MDRERILSAMEHIDAALVEEAAPGGGAACRHQRRKAAVIAACLCLALAGTVVAAGDGVLVRFLHTDAWRDAHDASAGGPVTGAYLATSAVRVPVSELSDAVRELAAGQDPAYPEYAYAFDSWAEMEGFIGLEVTDNHLQDTARQIPLTMRGKGTAHQGPVEGCSILTVFGDGDGNVKALKMTSSYELLGHSYCVSLTVNAAIATDHADAGMGTEASWDGTLGRVYTESDLKELATEEYVMANGQTAVIVSSPSGRDGLAQHRAYFQGENALVNVGTMWDHGGRIDQGNTEDYDRRAMQALKDVLDAFS